MSKLGRKPRPLAERFWKKVNKQGLNECWEWTASKYENGYGSIGAEGKGLKAHRVSWELHNGPIPRGMFILHHCDNPGCVNPAHLFLGIHTDNMQDMTQKGRQAKGEANGQAKVTKQQVYSIRRFLALGYTQSVIAKMFGVSTGAVNFIATGRNWGWLS